MRSGEASPERRAEELEERIEGAEDAPEERAAFASSPRRAGRVDELPEDASVPSVVKEASISGKSGKMMEKPTRSRKIVRKIVKWADCGACPRTPRMGCGCSEPASA
jgi:hypothetical protein